MRAKRSALAPGTSRSISLSITNGRTFFRRSARPRMIITVTATIEAAHAAFSTQPTNTVISIPVPLALIADAGVRRLLGDHGDLAGLVLDVTEFTSAVTPETFGALVTTAREALNAA